MCVLDAVDVLLIVDVCVYMCVHACLCVFMCALTAVDVLLIVDVCVYMCVHVCLCVFMCVLTTVAVLLIVDMCVYMFANGIFSLLCVSMCALKRQLQTPASTSPSGNVCYKSWICILTTYL